MITLSTSTSGATIRYSLDGSIPSETHGTVYSTPITLSASTQLPGTQVVITAIAYQPGWTNSIIFTSQPYFVKAVVVAPQFSPNGGAYADDNTDRSMSVSISSSTEGVSIRYTVDGSMPSSSSGVLYTQPIVASYHTVGAGTYTIRAIAFKYMASDSDISTSSAYTVSSLVDPPTANPNGGTHGAGLRSVALSLSTTTPGSIIRYTTNGDTPTSSSSAYSTPVSFTSPGTYIVRATAFMAGWSTSDMFVSEPYTVRQVVATPTLSQNGGTHSTAVRNITIQISASTAGASIRYSIDGSTPTRTSGLLYLAPILFARPAFSAGTYTIKAIAFQAGWSDSNVLTSAAFTLRDFVQVCLTALNIALLFNFTIFLKP